MPSRLRFRCIVPTDPSYDQIALLRAEAAVRDLGADMVIEAVSRAEVHSRLGQNEYEAALGPVDTGKSLARLYPYWRSFIDDVPEFLGGNYMAASRPLDALRTALSDADRQQAAAELQRVMYEDPSSIFLVTRQDARAVSRRFAVLEDAADIVETLWRWRPADASPVQ